MKSLPQDSPPTGRRLGRLLLGYLLVAVAAIVLAPFEVHWPPRLDWTLVGPGGFGAADMVLNVVLFVPLGFLAERQGRGHGRLGQIALAAMLLSLAIECVQLVIPGRWSSFSDVVANTVGGVLGGVASRRLRDVVGDGSHLAGRLFLDLPLVGFLWLMVPLLWLDALAAGEKVAMIAAAAAAGVALAAATASSRGGRPAGRGRLVMVATGWGTIAMAPLALVSWRVAAASFLMMILAMLVAERRFDRVARRERRIEPGAVVVILVLLLPLLVATTMPGLVPGLGEARLARQGILRWLAGAAAFTVLGFLMAEWRGRSPRRWPDIALAPMLLAALVTPLADAGPGIAGRLLPAIVAAGFGALLFELQREHVIALRRRPDRRGGPKVTNLGVER